jgi:hypothetical protein
MRHANDRKYPFLFLGQGFATSRKCLEGHLWFERLPKASEQKRIVELVPLPVLLGARFQGELMHFGSDDRFELFVKAAHARKFARIPFSLAVEQLERLWLESPDTSHWMPTRAEWAAFCDDFERAVRKIHRVCKLRLVCKPDDGEYGMKLGPWHRWSAVRAHRIAELASKDARKTTREMSYLAANLIKDLWCDSKSFSRLASEQRIVWLRWLDKLVAEGHPEVNHALVGWLDALLKVFPQDARDPMMRTLRKSTVRRLGRTQFVRDSPA